MRTSRRELLEMVARAAAAPGGAEFLAVWAKAGEAHHRPGSGAPPEPPLLREYQPKFFPPEDFQALEAFTEILIPSDETPGAREARCAHFIDFLLQASPPDTQTRWRAAMAALQDAQFHSSGPRDRAALVEAISRPERDRAASHPAYFAYRLIKQQNTFAFYTSRAGMIETLDYRGNSYNETFPACAHPEHHTI